MKGQKINSLIGIEVGTSATHSYWEHTKPPPQTYHLQNISHSSPFISLEYQKIFTRKLWLGIGVAATPVLYKRSIYYWDYPYMRKRTSLRGYGEVQFPLVIRYELDEGIFKQRYGSKFSLESGFITTWRNPVLSFNSGVLQINDSLATNRYEHGNHINFVIPVGLSYQVHLPNNKILKLKGLIGIGTKMQFREFIAPESDLTARTNGSFARLSLTYYFPLNAKDNISNSD